MSMWILDKRPFKQQQEEYAQKKNRMLEAAIANQKKKRDAALAEEQRKREADQKEQTTAQVKALLTTHKNESSASVDTNISTTTSEIDKALLQVSQLSSMQTILKQTSKTQYEDTLLHILAAGGDKNLGDFRTQLNDFSKKPDFDLKAFFGKGKKTVLHTAIENFSIENPSFEIVQFLMEKDPLLASIEDHHGNTPVHLAARLGDDGFEMIRILYSDSRNKVKDLTDAQNNKGQTPLFLSIISPHHGSKETENGFKTTAFLLGKNPDLTITTKKEKYTILHGAISAAKEKILIDLLLDRKITSNISSILNDTDHLGNTPVHHAAQQGSSSIIINKLRKAGADIAKSNHKGHNSLNICITHWAQHLHNVDRSVDFGKTAQALLESNTGLLQIKGPHDFISIHYAVNSIALFLTRNKPEDAKKVLPIIDFVFSRKAERRAIDCDGNRAFQRAIALGIPPTILKEPNFIGVSLMVHILDKLLLEDELESVNYASSQGGKNTALHYAVLLNTTRTKEIVTYLLEKGANTNLANGDGYHPLDLLNYLLSIKVNQLEHDQLIALKTLLEKKNAKPNVTITSQTFHLPEFTLGEDKSNWHPELFDDRAQTPTKQKFSVASSDGTANTSTFEMVSGGVSSAPPSEYTVGGDDLTFESHPPSEIASEDIPTYEIDSDSRLLPECSVELPADDTETTPTKDTTTQSVVPSELADTSQPEYRPYRP